MRCMLSPYFAHDPRQRCTESCGIKPLGLLAAAYLLLLTRFLAFMLFEWGEERVLGEGSVLGDRGWWDEIHALVCLELLEW